MVERRIDRILELQEHMTQFAISDERGVFTIDKRYETMLRPFFEEIEKLKAINEALDKHSKQSSIILKEIMEKLCENEVVKNVIYPGQHPAVTVSILEEELTKLIRKLVNLQRAFNVELLRTEVIDAEKPAEKELQQKILKIREQIKILKEAEAEYKSRVSKLPNPPELPELLPRGWMPIPTRDGVIVPKYAPELTTHEKLPPGYLM